MVNHDHLFASRHDPNTTVTVVSDMPGGLLRIRNTQTGEHFKITRSNFHENFRMV